jgi:hypothetical protein
MLFGFKDEDDDEQHNKVLDHDQPSAAGAELSLTHVEESMLDGRTAALRW